jgi:hypothetical protein
MGAYEYLLITHLDESSQAYGSRDPWFELKEREEREWGIEEG